MFWEMAALKVVVQKRALLSIEQVADWYASHLSEVAAMRFKNDVYNVIETLSKMPSIGVIDISIKSALPYYSFLVHPKYRLIYRYTKTTLYVVAIRANLKFNS